MKKAFHNIIKKVGLSNALGGWEKMDHREVCENIMKNYKLEYTRNCKKLPDNERLPGGGTAKERTKRNQTEIKRGRSGGSSQHGGAAVAARGGGAPVRDDAQPVGRVGRQDAERKCRFLRKKLAIHTLCCINWKTKLYPQKGMALAYHHSSMLQ